MEIRRAERRRARARVGVDGPAGAGKTHGLLLLAAGLVPDGRIIVIDTEHGSAEMEAGKAGIPAFDVLPLGPPYSPKRYVEAIHACEEAGADLIGIDSLSHAWTGTGGALDLVDRIAGSGNRFAAWRDVTPQHNALVDAILQSPAHVIVTMRTKMEYVLEQDEKGKTRVRKVGMAPIQREGMEFEFSVVFDVDQAKHYATASKDRTSLFDGQPPEILTPKHGAMLREWMESGAIPIPTPTPEPERAETNGNGKRKMTDEERRAAMLPRVQKMQAELDARAGGSAYTLMQASIGKGAALASLTNDELQRYGKALQAALDESQAPGAEG